MSGIIDRLKKEPALVIGFLAAAILAGVQYANGHDLLPGGVLDWVTNALDPNSGWAIPILVGLVTRFFVSPASEPGV